MDNTGMGLQMNHKSDCSGLQRLQYLSFGYPAESGDANICPPQGSVKRRINESIISDLGYSYDQPTSTAITGFLGTNTLHMFDYDFGTDTVIKGADFEQCKIDFPKYLATEKVKENGEKHSDIYVTGYSELETEWELNLFNQGIKITGRLDRQIWNTNAIINAGTIESVDIDGDYSTLETANSDPKTQDHLDLIHEINLEGIRALGDEAYSNLMHAVKNLTDPENVTPKPQGAKGTSSAKGELDINAKEVLDYYFSTFTA